MIALFVLEMYLQKKKYHFIVSSPKENENQLYKIKM